MTADSTIAGLILAAGASSRMGTPKALLEFQNQTFLDRLIGLFSQVTQPVLVVLGHDAERIRAGLRRAAGVQFVINPDPARGMLSSLQCGLAALPQNAEAVLFTLVDHPDVALSTVQAVASASCSHLSPVVIPTYGGERGHPVCISRKVAFELLALPVTASPKEVIRPHKPQTLYLPVNDPGVVSDIDDPLAYAALLGASRA